MKTHNHIYRRRRAKTKVENIIISVLHNTLQKVTRRKSHKTKSVYIKMGPNWSNLPISVILDLWLSLNVCYREFILIIDLID